jgi:glucarate dehydratase
MKIISVLAIPVAIPVKRVGYFSRARRTVAMRTIVLIECDNGVVGFGETRGTVAAEIIRDRFADALTGQTVTDAASLRSLCLPYRADYGYPDQLMDQNAYAALEMSILDCIGKDVGLPLYALLGGKCRTTASFVAYEYTVDPTEGVKPADVPERMSAKMAAAVASTGSNFVEFKVGVYPVATDIETVAAVRDRLGPHVSIGVDANMAWDFDTADRFIAATRAYGVSNIEEPVSNLAGMNRLAERHGVNVSSHATSPELLQHYPAIDGAVGEPHAEGSLMGCRDLSERLAAIGKRYWFRSVWEAGFSWAAMCHMSVAFPSLTRPMQSLFNHLGDDLIEETDFAMTNSAVEVPTRPGLGVTLDMAAIEKYRMDKSS